MYIEHIPIYMHKRRTFSSFLNRLAEELKAAVARTSAVGSFRGPNIGAGL